MTDDVAPIATVRDPHDAHQALRKRADEIGITRERLDELAHLAPGYSAKLLSDPPLKGLGLIGMFSLISALGMLMVLVENPKAGERLARERKRRGPQSALAWRNQRALAILREHARKGGLMRYAAITPAELKALRSAGGRARWAAMTSEERKAFHAAGGKARQERI